MASNPINTIHPSHTASSAEASIKAGKKAQQSKNSFLALLLSKLALQNAILGFILGLLIKHFFAFHSSHWFQMLEASLVFALMIGILVSGYLSENQGRLFLTRCAWAMLSLSLILLGVNHELVGVWIGLFFSFVTLGFFITVLPIYMAECAPSLTRGLWVISGFLAFLIGISLFTAIDFNIQSNWLSWYLLSNGLAIIALLLNYHSFESPAWLLEQARVEEAKKVLERLRPEEEVAKEIAVMKSSIRRRPRSWQQIYERQLNNKLKVGYYLAAFRQLTGIGVILFYLPNLFVGRWLVDPGVLWFLIFVSLSSGLLFAAIFVDSVGRRKLTLLSFLAQAIILILLLFTWMPTLPQDNFTGFLHEMFLLLCFIFFFALGAGPVTWLSWIELMPLRSRARYVATFLLFSLVLGIILWLVYYLVINLAGVRWFYALAALCALIATFYSCYKMPETKNHLLDEI